MKTKLFLLSLALSSSLSYGQGGGKEIGNGGKGILCTNGEVETLRVLDLVKGQDAWGFVYEQTQGENPFDLAANLVDRIEKFDPVRAKNYKKEIQEFLSNSRMFNNYDLFNIDDSTEFGIEKGCEIKVIVNQKAPKFQQDKKYRVNKVLWDKLSTADQAALILHEVIYSEALKLGQTSSDNVSYLNAYINSSQIKDDSLEEYLQVLNKIEFVFNHGGINIAEPRLDYLNNIALGYSKDSYYSQNGVHFSLSTFGTAVTFHQNGILKSAWVSEKFRFGGLKTDKISINGMGTRECRIKLPELAQFHETGVLVGAKIATKNCKGLVKDKSGEVQLKKLPKGFWIELDQDGYVIKRSLLKPSSLF